MRYYGYIGRQAGPSQSKGNIMAKKEFAAVTAVIADGKLVITAHGCEPMVVDPASLSQANRDYALLHGLKQRIVDAGALSTVGGGKPTPEEKDAAMRELFDHYMSGAEGWSPTRSGERGAGAEGGLTLRALAAIYGMDNDSMKAKVEALAVKRGMTTKAYYTVVATYPDVAAKIAEFKAARVAPELAESLLDELKQEGE